MTVFRSLPHEQHGSAGELSDEHSHRSSGLRGNVALSSQWYPGERHVRFGSKADMCSAKRHVRFTPNSDRKSGHRGARRRAEHFGSAPYFKRRPCSAMAHINAEVPHRTLYLGVTNQNLDGAQISGAAVDQCRLEEHASCKAMSAFTVAIRCKADMTLCAAHVRF